MKDHRSEALKIPMETKMKIWLNVLAIGLALAAQNTALLPAQDTTPPMPQVLYSSDPDIKYPQWVAVESMLGPDGELNADYLDELMIKVIKINMASPQENGCLQVSEAYDSFLNPPDLSSMKEVIRSSVLAMAARVTGKAFGFRDCVPGQLIRLEPIEVFYSKDKTLPEYFVFFPIGEFYFQNVRICKTDFRYPLVPEVGDDVFLAAHPYFYQYPADSFIPVGEGNELFTVTKNGQVSLPLAFRKDRSSKSQKIDLPRSREALEQIFRSNVKRN